MFLVDRMVSYCLPRRERSHTSEELAGLSDEARQSLYNEHRRKAKSLFKKARSERNTSGEWAELLLYVLLEHVHKAPQIVSKMFLKTSRQMHVHGTDGIHFKWDAATLTADIIWGESKGYATLEGAQEAAFDSIATFHGEPEKHGRDIDIAQDHIDLGDVDAETTDAIRRYINPYTRESLRRREVYACLLSYDDEAYKKILIEAPENREDALRRSLETKFTTQVAALEAASVEGLHAELNFEFFLIPVSSVQTIRKKFDELAEL
jgi:hypothetical protein